MKDHEIRPMLDRQLSACEWTAEDTQKLFRRMRKEKPCMKRKLSLAFVMMLLLLLAAGIALAAAGFGLLDSLRRQGGDTFLPQATDMIQPLSVTAETDDVTLAIREAAYDGHGAYILAAITPKDNATMLLSEDLTPSNAANGYVSELPATMEGTETTLAAYAAAHGYTRFVSADLGMDSISYTMDTGWQDGTLLETLFIPASGSTLTLPLSLSSMPVTVDGAPDASRFVREDFSLTLTASPALWQAASRTALELPACGLRVDGAVFTGTALACYYTLHCTVLDPDLVFDFFSRMAFKTEDGVPCPEGIMNRTCDSALAGQSLDITGSLVPFQQPPKQLTLSLIRSGDCQETELGSLTLEAR